ncbi:PD-(D/E)XK motif protein [Bradyrhizobium sp.]|uniref:PD-(D/E)XK motif protein n=1 Tax=Bradyrhizobium sp. TaxID=376 RepID=UPI0007C995FB|nr:PD-(D/E)XK motif protein [Bradyrhizobium sp.]
MEALSWDNLKDYIDTGTAAVCPIGGNHALSLFVGPESVRIGLRIPYSGELAVETGLYRELHCTIVMVQGVRSIELSTSSQPLFHSFYLFAYAIADLIESQERSPPAAIKEALDRFGLLLNEFSLLPETTRLGLLGELCFLEALVKARGSNFVEAWLGPVPQRHDFRLDDNEFEIKTTLKSKRQHLIHGFGQLETSPGKKLFIVSLHLERAGPPGGQTLPQKVAEVFRILGPDTTSFENSLGKLGYRKMDEIHYKERYKFRSAPTLIKVDESCPRISRAILSPALTDELLRRFGEMTYEINVDGLGTVQGTTAYADVVPGPLGLGLS